MNGAVPVETQMGILGLLVLIVGSLLVIGEGYLRAWIQDRKDNDD